MPFPIGGPLEPRLETRSQAVLLARIADHTASQQTRYVVFLAIVAK